MSPAKNTAIVALFVTTVLLTACDSSRIYEENLPLENNSWEAGKPARFQAGINDTSQPCNFYLNIRNSPEYAFSNLFLFMTTKYPDGSLSKDTIELRLADLDGRWLGSGMGSVKFSRFLLKKGVRFAQAGLYTFEFEQAMRVKELKGIRDIGIRIESH